jgi:hypothetical protein
MQKTIQSNRSVAPRFYPVSQQKNRKVSASVNIHKQLKND